MYGLVNVSEFSRILDCSSGRRRGLNEYFIAIFKIYCPFFNFYVIYLLLLLIFFVFLIN